MQSFRAPAQDAVLHIRVRGTQCGGRLTLLSRERNRDPEESLLATSQGSGALFCFDFVPVATLCSAPLCEELAEPQSHRSCGSLEER